MKSAGIRKHHRRIEHQTQIDKRDRQEREFKQKEHVPAVTERVAVSVADICSKIARRFNRFVNRFLGKTSINLDLTSRSGRHAIFGTGRDAGAQWLRNVFGQQLKMRSTRDGKPV